MSYTSYITDQCNDCLISPMRPPRSRLRCSCTAGTGGRGAKGGGAAPRLRYYLYGTTLLYSVEESDVMMAAGNAGNAGNPLLRSTMHVIKRRYNYDKHLFYPLYHI